MIHSLLAWIKRSYRWFRSAYAQPKFRTLITAGIMLVSFSFIGLIIFKNWTTVRGELWKFDPIYLVYAFLSFPAGMIPTVIAWHYLLRSLNVRQSFLTDLRIYSLSAIPRHVPGLVLYVSSRSLMYENQGVPAAITMTATALEILFLSLVGFAIGIIVFGVNLGVAARQGYFPAILLSTAILVGVMLLLFFALPKVKPIRDGLGGKLKIPRLDRGNLILAFFWMIWAWVGGGLCLHLLSRSVAPVSWSDFPVMAGIWAVSGAMSMTLGALTQGFGVREFTMGSLLTLLVPPAVAVVIAVGFRLAFTLFELVWVSLFVAGIKWLPFQKEMAAKDAKLP